MKDCHYTEGFLEHIYREGLQPSLQAGSFPKMLPPQKEESLTGLFLFFLGFFLP